MTRASFSRRVTSEFVGTALLVATVVGSGVMGERLASGNIALALLANTIATGAILIALILTFGGISGAHFNPAVTIADALEHGLAWREVPGYVGAQCLGGIAGAIVAHAMFSLPLLSMSHHARSGAAQVFSEFIAAFGLLSVIWGCSRLRRDATPYAVGAYITAAYWFTSSTSFANPAVTIARCISDTFAGIRPADVPPFIAAQLCGALAATGLFRWLTPDLSDTAEDILMPHDESNRAASKKDENTHGENKKLKTYLFACVHNAGRSQMAAALFNRYVDQRTCLAISAGTAPAGHIHPEVIAVMKEVGIDLSSAHPQKLTQALAEASSILITMGCGESCPYIPGLRTVDWALSDPKGQSIEAVRSIRDNIHERVKSLIQSECADCCVA